MVDAMVEQLPPQVTMVVSAKKKKLPLPLPHITRLLNRELALPTTVEWDFCFFFLFFVIPFIILALLFSLPASRNSDPGPHSRLFSPLPTTVRAFHFYGEKTSALSFLIGSRRKLCTFYKNKYLCAYSSSSSPRGCEPGLAYHTLLWKSGC